MGHCYKFLRKRKGGPRILCWIKLSSQWKGNKFVQSTREDNIVPISPAFISFSCSPVKEGRTNFRASRWFNTNQKKCNLPKTIKWILIFLIAHWPSHQNLQLVTTGQRVDTWGKMLNLVSKLRVKEINTWNEHISRHILIINVWSYINLPTWEQPHQALEAC